MKTSHDMDQNHSPKILQYIFFLACVFAVLFVLDQVFDWQYEPKPLDIDESKILTKKNDKKPESSLAPTQTELKTSSSESKIEEVNASEPEAITDNSSTSSADELPDLSPDIFFDQLFEKYNSEVLSKIESNKARTDIVIRYYRHPPDGNSAYELEKLGFYIHERPVSPKFKNYQSNAIFIGDSVSLSDVQVVGFTLLKEGLPIKVIRPSKFGSSWKSKSIEIGTDTTLVDLPSLTLEEIKNLNF